jgi:hypothetical protein
LAVLVNGSVHVPPDAGDLDVGLIDEPARPDRVTARSRRVDEQWREALHPPEQGDVIDIDAALGKELLEIAIRQPEAQIPANRQHDHLGREPEASERREFERRHWTTVALHQRTLALGVRSVNATEPPMLLQRCEALSLPLIGSSDAYVRIPLDLVVGYER